MGEPESYQRRISAKVVAVGSAGVILDRTIFYPTGGGQPGDSGALILSDGRRLRVIDAKHADDGPQSVLHVLEHQSAVEINSELMAEIDWDRRYRHMRMHTALHLLSAFIDAPVTGCAISAEKGRLDFDLPEPSIDKDQITECLRDFVARQLPVHIRFAGPAELATLPQVVRTRSVAPPIIDGQLRLVEIPGVDVQACGGTHVMNTAEVGAVRCVKIEKKSRHNRRIVLEFEN
jgi:misacylated tRNA(Ala) deacylase